MPRRAHTSNKATPAEIAGLPRLPLDQLPKGLAPAPVTEMERLRDLIRDHERRLQKIERKER